MAKVCGIVLAAGLSSRLGQPKQLLPFGDTTLLGWVVRSAETSSLDRVVVVIGNAAEQVRVATPTRRAEVVCNDAYASGSASSLQTGLDAAGDCDAVLLVLGDVPGVSATMIDAVRRDWERHRPFALVTSYRGEVAHPLMFSSDAFSALRSGHGDKPVWKLLDRHPDRVRQIGFDLPVPVDVNTWDDYHAAAAHLRPGGRHRPGVGLSC